MPNCGRFQPGILASRKCFEIGQLLLLRVLVARFIPIPCCFASQTKIHHDDAGIRVEETLVETSQVQITPCI